jgi:hypothetical protein
MVTATNHHLQQYRLKVDKAIEEARDLLSVLERSTVLREQQVVSAIANEIQTVIDRLSKDELTVSVVAEFAVGKSHTVNALLFGETVLESTAGVSTTKKYEVIYGEVPQLIYVERATGKVHDRALTLAELKEYVKMLNRDSKVGGPNEYASEVTVRYPSRLLQQGLRLIDTPGLGSLNEEIERQRVVEALSKSDAVIFINDASQGGGRAARETWTTLFDQIPESKRWCLLNKIDQWEAGEERDEQVALGWQALVDALFDGKAPETARIYAISAREALKGKMTENPELLRDSRIQRFENDLFDALTRDRFRDFIEPEIQQLINLKGTVRTLVRGLRADHERRIQHLNSGSKEKIGAIEALRQTLKYIAAQGKKVGSNTSGLRPKFRGELRQMKQDLSDDFERVLRVNLESFEWTDLLNAKSKLDTCLKQTQHDFAECVVSRKKYFDTFARSAIDDVDKEYKQLIATCASQLERIGLDINLDLSALNGSPEVDADPTGVSLGDSDYNALGELLKKVVVGAALEQLLLRGAVSAIPVIGIALGVVLFIWDASRAPQRIRESVLKEVLPGVQQQIASNMKDAEALLEASLKRVEAMLSDNLKSADSKLREALMTAQGNSREIGQQLQKLTKEKTELDDLVLKFA